MRLHYRRNHLIRLINGSDSLNGEGSSLGLLSTMEILFSFSMPPIRGSTLLHDHYTQGFAAGLKYAGLSGL